ncbi:MAG: response regulator, partial [Deltaproteobacteria bacterium]|nr:response regulator [Deltaproteobacteria bacterium]
GVWTRLIVCCLFIIFGSHAQYTINQRKKMEDALTDSEEKYRTIVESLEDGYYEIDLRGNFIFFNDALCGMLGYERNAMEGINIKRFVDEENEKKIFDIFRTVLNSAHSINAFDSSIIRKDGAIRVVESSLSLIKDATNQPIGFRGISRDVTERKEAEALTQEKMAAEAASRSKNEFLANMSHEIRTPLNSITGITELVLDAQLRPEQREDPEAVKAALGLSADRQEITPKTRKPLLQFGKQALHILVAEDTPFNQKFIQRLLTRWGLKATIVGNGIQAVKAAARQSFDIILMDVQMPEMDGFEAAVAIRKLESRTGRHTPIIAMTAHAMKGDRERCLAAGMDDYLPKPISSDALQNMIAELVPVAPGLSQPPANQKSEAPAATTFDKTALLKAFDNDWAFFREAVDIFLSDFPQMVSRIETAVHSNDAHELHLAAHSLKGMVGNFQAQGPARAALALEEMGRNRKLDGAEKALQKLTDEMTNLKQTLTAIAEEENH